VPARRSARVLLGAIVALAYGCRHATHPNVVLIVLDTLRADRVGWYGDTRGVTPALDELARRSDVFWKAYSVSSWTSPAVASVLTSRPPARHGVRGFGSTLADDETTLAETLHAHGYRTAAFQANPLLSPRLGYAQGFDVYEVGELMSRARVKDRAGRLDDAALAWLDGLRAYGEGGPVFLYLQYMEAHPPYTVGARRLARMVGERGRSGEESARATALLEPSRQWDIFLAPSAWPQIDPGALRALEDVYDAEVASLDAHLHGLLRGLAKRGILDDAVIVVMADHGEEFADHGRIGHGFTLYDEVLHVPLLVRAPGQRDRHDVRDVVSLLDVAPTIVDLAGIPAPPTFEGRSMARPASRVARAELDRPRDEMIADPAHRRALVVGSEKMIVDVHGQRACYDLAADPEERRPGDGSACAIAPLDRDEAGADGAAPPPPLDDETRARLRALGYVAR
jgi:arylsulfatase A-like enzyme